MFLGSVVSGFDAHEGYLHGPEAQHPVILTDAYLPNISLVYHPPNLLGFQPLILPVDVRIVNFVQRGVVLFDGFTLCLIGVF
jgi:hypothetical protein